MITVNILINGQPIATRSACNCIERNEKGETKYETDCGSVVWHKREDGAVALAIQLIKLLKPMGGVEWR